MLDISAHIVSLLHRYDCVVIPELGGFVANYSSSQLDRNRGVIYPPSKGIIFNKNLTKNDGLLVAEIAEALGVNYNNAFAKVNEFVNEARHNLQHGGRIEIGGLGYLYFDHERNVQFLAVNTVNFLSESFGLFPVNAIPVKKEAVIQPIQPVIEKVIEKVEKVEVIKEKETKVVSIEEAGKIIRKNRSKYYWAAAVLLPILFYSYWIPFQTQVLVTGKLPVSELNPFAKRALPIYSDRSDVDPVKTTNTFIEREDSVFTVPMADENLANVAETTYVPENTTVKENHYHVIGGCFISYENAVNHLNELNKNGLNAFLFGQADGFHRVSLGSFATKDEAIQKINAIRQAGQPNCWLLVE